MSGQEARGGDDDARPSWWRYAVFGACAFSIGYFAWHGAPALRRSYGASRAASQRREAERASRVRAMSDDDLRALSRDPAAVARGRRDYVQSCAACHRADGGGQTGPNLTDDRWIHGGAPRRILRTVDEGVPARAMPAWGVQLGAERTAAVVAFLLTLRNTNVAGGKAPQGEVHAGD